jgi:hypothetical protein
MDFSHHKKTIFIWLYFIFISIWFLFLQSQPDKETYLNYLINPAIAFIYWFAGYVSFTAGRKIGPTTTMGKALQSIALASLSYAMALIIWTWYVFVDGAGIPYPSLADIFFILFIPGILYGTLQLLTLYGSAFTINRLLRSIFIAGTAFSVLFYFTVLPSLSKDAPLLEIFFDILYPISDFILMLIATVGITLSGGMYRKSLTLLSCGLLCQVVGDSFFSYRTSHSLYWNGDIADYFFTLSAFLLVLSILKILRTYKKRNSAAR